MLDHQGGDAEQVGEVRDRGALAVLAGVGDAGVVDGPGDQKLRAVHMGDGSIAFVEQAIEVGTKNIGMLPRNFDLDEVVRDMQSRQRLHSLRLDLTRVLELVQNAEVAHGSDAMTGALDIYHQTKNADGQGVEALRKMMGKRFDRGPQETPPGTPPAA